MLDPMGFVKHLKARGAEICAPTNVWEVVRYKTEGETHIIYMKKSGALTYTGKSQDHYINFLSNCNQLKKFRASKASKSKTSMKTVRDKLRERDGICCWYCGIFIEDEGTVEHLIPRSVGGSNAPSNLVLAHQTCNQRAGNASLASKIELRAAMRAERVDRPAWAE